MAKLTVPADHACGTCGSTFLVKPSRQAKAQFCSAKCRDEANRRPPTAEMLRSRTREIPSGCWIWTGQKTKNGYGLFRHTTTHRVMYEVAVGPIPTGYTIDHVKARGCISTSCVNPTHLEAVPHRVNLWRGDGWAGQRARQTHCKRGHLFDEANTRVKPNGTRHCRECDRQHSRNIYRQKQRTR